MLFQADSPAWALSRYYQDAAIRAAFEKILLDQQAGLPSPGAADTGHWRGQNHHRHQPAVAHEPGQAIAQACAVSCDRDELRGQAFIKLKAAFGDSARIVKTEHGDNAAKNARIHIATYQTLGLDDDAGGDAGFASFLSEHYGPDAFSVIVIDECHRSAWGRWSEVLRRNPNAIHIGLTATPRRLEESNPTSAEAQQDHDITANNRQYFGEPVYEYTLIQAQEDGYLAAAKSSNAKPASTAPPSPKQTS